MPNWTARTSTAWSPPSSSTCRRRGTDVAIPAPLLLVLIGVWLACGLLVSIWPAGQWAWLAAGGGFAVLSGIDVAGARQRSRGLTVARTLPPILAVGRR